MKIIITAGGGGHFSPALAVMKKLPKGTELLYIGRKYAFENDKTLAFEYQTVKTLGIPFRTITTGRLQRSFSYLSLMSLLKVPVGLFQSFRILRKEKPDVVFSTGGYVALPVTLAAALLRIPVVIHEQTLHAGLANRIASKFARKICLSFPTSVSYFPQAKTIVTGNPLREEFLLSAEPKKRFPDSLPIILVTGGSLGSHAINRLIERTLERLLGEFNIIHQTGAAEEYQDFERLTTVKQRLPENLQDRYLPVQFIDPSEMPDIMRQASMVISRAGMSTINELIYFQKPSLLIPLPHGQRNEQMENAAYLASIGLARVKKEEELMPETLYTEIKEITDQLDSFRLKPDIPSPIQKDAAEKIITTLLSVTQKLSTPTS